MIPDGYGVWTLAKFCSVESDLPEYLVLSVNLKKKKEKKKDIVPVKRHSLENQRCFKLLNQYNSLLAATDSGIVKQKLTKVLKMIATHKTSKYVNEIKVAQCSMLVSR